MARSLVTSLPTSWAGEWGDHRVVVLGSGDSGFAIADTLHELGASVVMVTPTPSGDAEKILGVLGVDCVSDAGLETMIPASFAPTLAILAAPRYRHHPVASSVVDGGGGLWSELEFSLRVSDKFGSRPTTVLLAGHRLGEPISHIVTQICAHAGVRAITVGSVGVVALDAIRDPAKWAVMLWPLGVGELEDLRLDTDPLRNPSLTVALDDDELLTPEAMDQVYFRTEKACLYSRGGGASETALEEAWVEEGARAIGVGLDSPGMSDLGIVDDIVCDRAFLDDRRNHALELTTLGELRDVGVADTHQLGVVIAALAIARALDISAETIGEAVKTLSL
jgi:UDP-N-acetylmuramoylalanine--D-glutamate ligase